MIPHLDPQLWQDWAAHYTHLGIDTSRLSRDGPVDPESYFNAPIKVLFILKEVHAYRLDLVKHLQGGPRGCGVMWHAIARWAAGIQNDFPPYEEIKIDEAKTQALKSSAVVNLKKTGGGSSSNMSEINAYALRDRKLLKRQIRGLKPDYVIACGTFDAH